MKDPIKLIQRLRAIVAVIALFMAGYLFWKIQAVKAKSTPPPSAVRIVAPQPPTSTPISP